MSYDLVEAVLASGASLPSPGLAMVNLQQAMSNELAGTREYAGALASDPAVCGALMRVANSPVFNTGRKAETVEQAVSLLGLSRTQAITSAICLRSQAELLEGPLRHQVLALFEQAEHWAAASFIAARASSARRLAEQAYLAALMQDCGVIVLARRGAAISLQAGDGSDGHPALGAALLRNWKLPAEITAAVGLQHNPREAAKSEGDAALLAALLAAGRYLCDPQTPDWPAWSEPCAERLGLDDDTLGECAASLRGNTL